MNLTLQGGLLVGGFSAANPPQLRQTAIAVGVDWRFAVAKPSPRTQPERCLSGHVGSASHPVRYFQPIRANLIFTNMSHLRGQPLFRQIAAMTILFSLKLALIGDIPPSGFDD
ncbi:MAG: hypothetical protein M0Q44_04210 [Methylobacter sp.]|nr:hypothetical protein [Methylobacter sp.]